MSFELPPQNTFGEFIASERVASRCTSEATNEQHIAIEFATRNLEQQRIRDAMSREQSNFRLCSPGYNLFVRLDACFGISLGDAVGAKLRRSFRRRRRRGIPDDEARLRTNQQRAGDEKTFGVSQINTRML